MHIVIVSEYYRPWPGGISEHVHHEAAELLRRGHRVTILTGPSSVSSGQNATCPPPKGAQLIELQYAVKFPSNGAASRLTLDVRMLRFGRLLEDLAPDVVHVHAPLDPFLCLTAVLSSSCPTVGTFHANFTPGPLWRALYGKHAFLTRWAFDRLDARIAVSQEARRSIAHYMPGHIELLANGVDLQRFNPKNSPAADVADEQPTILFVGRPDERKGLELLVTAYDQVKTKIPKARLVVVGPVSDSERLRLVSSLTPTAVDDILFTGYVEPTELPGYYAGCDVFCSPAISGESQGIVLLESMACGKPVVMFDIPGYRDVVRDGVEGCVAKTIDSVALAEQLTSLLEDKKLRTKMGRAGLARAKAFSWPTIVDRLEDTFLTAIDSFVASRRFTDGNVLERASASASAERRA